jgi:hypothetical protein
MEIRVRRAVQGREPLPYKSARMFRATTIPGTIRWSVESLVQWGAQHADQDHFELKADLSVFR